MTGPARPVGDSIRLSRSEGDRLLVAEMFLPMPRDQVFAFFQDPWNLERITPPELRFRILTPRPIDLCAGALIDYRLTLWGIPIRWTSMISAWRPPEEFVDEQVRGPYGLWAHRHRFDPVAEGTRAIDEVRYRMPGGVLGDLVHPVVRRQLVRIFEYRRDRVRAILLGPREPHRRA